MGDTQDFEPVVDTSDSKEPQPERYRQHGRWRRVGRFSLKLLLILGALFVLFILGLSLMSSLSIEGVEGFREGLERADNYMVLVRLLIIGSLIAFWRPFNTWLAKAKGWPDEQLESVLAGRWWALGLLLFVELVLVQRIHEVIIGMFV
jgi:hypothetical protein